MDGAKPAPFLEGAKSPPEQLVPVRENDGHVSFDPLERESAWLVVLAAEGSPECVRHCHYRTLRHLLESDLRPRTYWRFAHTTSEDIFGDFQAEGDASNIPG